MQRCFQIPYYGKLKTKLQILPNYKPEICDIEVMVENQYKGKKLLELCRMMNEKACDILKNQNQVRF